MGDATSRGTVSSGGGSSGESSQDELESPEEGGQQGLPALPQDQGEQEIRNQLQGIPADHVHVVHDPFQLPLAGAGALPPVLAMGGAGVPGALQGLEGAVGRGQHVMGAVPRPVRAHRRNTNPPPP